MGGGMKSANVGELEYINLKLVVVGLIFSGVSTTFVQAVYRMNADDQHIEA